MSEYKDVSDLNDDELRALVDGPMDDQSSGSESEPEPEPEPTGGDEVKETVTEGEKPLSQEPEPDPLEAMKLEIERLKILAEKAEHYRLMHDKLSGQYGDLNRRYRDMQAGTRGGGDLDATDDIESIKSKLSAIEERERKRMRDEASRAVMEEAQAFATKFPDISEYGDKIKEHLGQRYHLVQEALETGDPDVARNTVRDLVRDAYFTARETALRDRIAQAEAKRADAAKELQRRKTEASMSGRGGQKVAQAARPTSLKDLSDDDLRRLVDQV